MSNLRSQSKSCRAFATEAQLFEALCQMSSKAYQCLYDQCYGSVEHFIIKNNGTADDAADYFQNGLASLCANVTDGTFTLQPTAKISTYLIEICRRQWLGYLRSKHFQVTQNREDIFHNEVADEVESADFEEVAHYRIQALSKALLKLGGTCQKIIQWFFVEHYSLKEIAQKLNSTEGTVKVSRFRCTEQLKKSLSHLL